LNQSVAYGSLKHFCTSLAIGVFLAVIALITPNYGRLDFEYGSFTGWYRSGGRFISGTFVWNIGCAFDGRWQNSEDGRTLHGKYECIDGFIFIGEALDNERRIGLAYYCKVHGSVTWENGNTFYGNWLDSSGEQIRRGRFEFTNGNIFVGDAIARNGSLLTGTLSWPSGSSFTGDWIDTPYGRIRQGTHTSADGTTRTGRFDNNTGRFLE